MNIGKKIIITDTNIITDLDIAEILDEFVKLDNVYICNIVKRDEINNKTCNLETIKKLKTISVSDNELLESIQIYTSQNKLSMYDLINFIIARDNFAILATGDNRLRNYALNNNVEVIRTLKIIKLMYNFKIISKSKAIYACSLLKESPKARIPIKDIDNLIKEIQEDYIKQ